MDIIGVGSHRLVLESVLQRIVKPVLELGAGDFSTPIIHKYLIQQIPNIVTIDTNQEWIDRYKSLFCPTHSFLCLTIDELQDYHKNDTNNWGLVFIDSYNWDMRMLGINAYKDTVDYIIVHDTAYSAEAKIFGTSSKKRSLNHQGIRDFSTFFKYWVEYLPEGMKLEDPPTVLGSNKIDVRELKVRGMLISNKAI